jgi:hypothetical protein
VGKLTQSDAESEAGTAAPTGPRCWDTGWRRAVGKPPEFAQALQGANRAGSPCAPPSRLALLLADCSINSCWAVTTRAALISSANALAHAAGLQGISLRTKRTAREPGYRAVRYVQYGVVRFEKTMGFRLASNTTIWNPTCNFC